MSWKERYDAARRGDEQSRSTGRYLGLPESSAEHLGKVCSKPVMTTFGAKDGFGHRGLSVFTVEIRAAVLLVARMGQIFCSSHAPILYQPARIVVP